MQCEQAGPGPFASGVTQGARSSTQFGTFDCSQLLNTRKLAVVA